MSETQKLIVPRPRNRVSQAAHTAHDGVPPGPARQRVEAPDPMPGATGERPTGMSFLIAIQLLACGSLVLNAGSELQVQTQLGAVRYALLALVYGLVIFQVVASLALWCGQKWAWWLTQAVQLSVIVESVRGLIGYQSTNAVLDAAGLATKHSNTMLYVRIVVNGVVFAYLLSESVLRYCDISFRPRKKTATSRRDFAAQQQALGLVGSSQDAFERELEISHLAAWGIRKSYRKGQHSIPVLSGVDLAVHRGEFLAIIGQSGSGKSTLLHLLGTLDAPSGGEIHFLGQRIDDLPAATREKLRNDQFGMIFQFYHLLPELSTLENVLAPLMIGHSTWDYWRKKSEYVERAKHLLDTVGLSHRLKHKPRELSGGEMQRVAIARALITKPQVLLADEPTGNLDAATGAEILQILRTLNREQGLSIVMVTHDAAIAAQADRVVRLVNGQVATAA